MKVIIFDAGTLITFSMNCLLHTLRDLKKKFNGKFIVTGQVYNEIVDKPLTIKKYKLGAIRLKALVDDKTLELPSSLGINEKEIRNLTDDYLKKANSMFYTHRRDVHIIDVGEASALALSKILRDKNIENVIAMDERTTRVLCEKPENLRDLLERKLHTKIEKKGDADKFFKGFSFIRSTELIFVAYKKGIFSKNKELLDALLYGAKFKGAAISGDEIREMKRMA